MKRIGVLLLLAVVAAPALYLAAALEWTYSDGERAGWIQKFSRKGWVCKTWEGELAMVSLPGSVPEKFYFTVRDVGVAAQVGQSVGLRVRLHYNQHRGLPGSCFGETGYWVDAVTPVAELTAPPPAAAAPATAPPAVAAPAAAPH